MSAIRNLIAGFMCFISYAICQAISSMATGSAGQGNDFGPEFGGSAQAGKAVSNLAMVGGKFLLVAGIVFFFLAGISFVKGVSKTKVAISPEVMSVSETVTNPALKPTVKHLEGARCRYCGTINKDEKLTNCPHCGAGYM